MHFKNKVIWITGASSGIGAELAIQLAQKGAKLILTARREDKLQEVKKACVTDTEACTILPADLLNNERLELVTQTAINTYGHIDIVIHTAGITQRSLAQETDISVYRTLMELNFFAPITITKHLLPHFAKNKSGHIVAISSMAGLMGFPKRTGYAASKHALKGYFETLQAEHNIPDLNITIVSPGRINTDLSLSAITADGSSYGKADSDLQQGISVHKCAERIIHAIANKKKHVIIAKEERLLYWFWWFIPNLYYRIARKAGLKN